MIHWHLDPVAAIRGLRTRDISNIDIISDSKSVHAFSESEDNYEPDSVRFGQILRKIYKMRLIDINMIQMKTVNIMNQVQRLFRMM